MLLRYCHCSGVYRQPYYIYRNPYLTRKNRNLDNIIQHCGVNACHIICRIIGTDILHYISDENTHLQVNINIK